MTIKIYKDLEIYKISYDLAIRVHRMTMKLPQFELYEEGGQLRKSSKSVTSNIVEGYGRRRYKAEFIRFLVFALASCDETIVHLNVVKDTHDIDRAEIEDLVKSYDALGSRMNKFVQYVEGNWRAGSGTDGKEVHS